MKRMMLILFIGLMVIWAIRARHGGPPHGRDHAIHHAKHAIAQAGHEARQALREAGDEVRDALRQAREEIQESFDDPDLDPATDRENADDLPVPIIRGSRVVDAQLETPAPAAASVQTITGLLSATEARALAEAKTALDRTVAHWLEPDVKAPWTPPANLVKSTVLASTTKLIHKDYGDLYATELKLDLSPEKRRAFLSVYSREVVRGRMITLGGGLGFILVCLAVVSGYIRADEATRGYYTQRLRLLAAAGVGAAGVMIYQLAV